MTYERNATTDILAGYIFSLMEGDSYLIEEMHAFLCEMGYCDEAGFPIDNDE
jgi:hypothetical protein